MPRLDIRSQAERTTGARRDAGQAQGIKCSTGDIREKTIVSPMKVATVTATAAGAQLLPGGKKYYLHSVQGYVYNADAGDVATYVDLYETGGSPLYFVLPIVPGVAGVQQASVVLDVLTSGKALIAATDSNTAVYRQITVTYQEVPEAT